MTTVLKPTIHLSTNGSFVGDPSALFDTCGIIISALFDMNEERLVVTHDHNPELLTSIRVYVGGAIGNGTEPSLQSAILGVLGQPELTCEVEFETPTLDDEVEDWDHQSQAESDRKIDQGAELARRKLFGFAA